MKLRCVILSDNLIVNPTKCPGHLGLWPLKSDPKSLRRLQVIILPIIQYLFQNFSISLPVHSYCYFTQLLEQPLTLSINTSNMFTSLLSIFPNPLDVKGVSALSQNDFSPYPNPLPIATHLKVAIVNCDTPVPTIKTSHGEYSNLFIETLTSAASRLRSSHNLHITFTFSTFDAVTDYLPNPADGYSAIIISGSCKLSPPQILSLPRHY